MMESPDPDDSTLPLKSSTNHNHHQVKNCISYNTEKDQTNLVTKEQYKYSNGLTDHHHGDVEDHQQGDDHVTDCYDDGAGGTGRSRRLTLLESNNQNHDAKIDLNSPMSLQLQQHMPDRINLDEVKQSRGPSSLSNNNIIDDNSSRNSSQSVQDKMNSIDNNEIMEELVDITKPFMQAVQCLELGELFHDPCFGLFEAMSAIEMMDPKMDAGMICNKGKRVVLNFEQSVEAGVLKLDNFTPEELIGIMDTTICSFITWLEGHSLAQTVFTNLYLHNPTVIIDKNLKAFSIAMLKLIDVTEECISKASVFEEEDFQASVYGYNLATQISGQKTTSMLRECDEEIQKMINKSQKSQIQNNLQHQKSESSNNNSNSINQYHNHHQLIEQWVAVQARLKFIRVFHLFLSYIWKRENLGDCQKLVSLCFESLAVLQKTFELGISRSSDESESFLMGFEPLVNQRLLPPTFPRSTRIKYPDEAFKYLKGLLERSKLILKVTSIQSFHGIIEFFNSFSESQPCVLSRSLLQLLYSPLRFKKPGVDEMIDSMKDSVKNFIAPPALMSKVPQQLNPEVGECVEMFFDRCATPFATLLVVWGHNRARQRDKLDHLLEDFAELQLETERIDAYIHTLCDKMEGVRPHGNCFGNWLLYHISKIMIRYILTGFELELYSIHEFAYIYWYLYEYLYGWLLSALSRAENYVTEQDTANEKSAKKGARSKNKTNSKKSKAYTKEVCITQAEQHLAGGYFKAMMGFLNDKKIPLPHAEFDNENVRYRHRFSAFNTIRTPAPVRYFQYKSVSDLTSIQQSSHLYEASAKSFQQAKQFLEAIPTPEKEVTELLKVAKTNLIVVKLLASGHTKNSTVPPEFDFSSHMHFPIIKVK